MVVRVSVVCLRDCVADGKLRLPALVHPHKRGSYLGSLSQEKIKSSNFEIQFLLNVYHLGTIIKLKNHKLNHPKLGTICVCH